MMSRDKRASAALVAVACSAVLLLSGCKQILPFIVQPPAKFDQNTANNLAAAQKDADALFGALSATTGCAYGPNTAQFDLVDKDLSALVAEAGSIPNNSFTTNGAMLLQKGFDKFRAAAKSKDPACLPPGLAEDKKTSFDGAATNLLAYENAKPKG
jgi:hypothetical protein